MKVTSGLSNKVRAGELMAEQVKPKSPSASTDGEDEEEEDDEFELDASDIDILQDIRSAEKRKKKKKKKKRPVGSGGPGGAAPTAAGVGASPAGGASGATAASAASAAAAANRSGLGLLTDKRTGQRLELRKDELTMGRVQGNDLILTDGQVSSRHCKIFRRESAYFIVDLGSTNGTYVNNDLVSSKQAVRLKDDDRIVVARTKELPNGAREFVFNQHP